MNGDVDGARRTDSDGGGNAMVASAMADACRTRERGMRDEWMLPQAPPPDYGRGVDLPAVVTGILFNRGIRDDEIGPFLKPDMPEAVDRLRLACAAGETILVNGDFDVDGVTAALVLAETLDALGASVLVHFPDRDTDGHGLQPDTVDRYRAHGVSVIVTADCGSGSCAAAERAAVLAMDFVITDHHPLGAGPLPRALAVVNPRRGDCPYPFKDLSGAAVAFKVASMLVSDRPNAAYLRRSVLDLVALGVIADCVPLRGENRILVRYGLPCA